MKTGYAWPREGESPGVQEGESGVCNVPKRLLNRRDLKGVR